MQYASVSQHMHPQICKKVRCWPVFLNVAIGEEINHSEIGLKRHIALKANAPAKRCSDRRAKITFASAVDQLKLMRRQLISFVQNQAAAKE